MKSCWLSLCIIVLGVCGCVRTSEITADANYRNQAEVALSAGQYSRARAFVARADKVNLARTALARRTLDLRIAQEEGVAKGEYNRLQLEWMKQRTDWSAEERIEAELALIASLSPNYALERLYDMDPTDWPPALRTRYNLLFAQMLVGKPMLYDTMVAQWTSGVRGLYEQGLIEAAAAEAKEFAYKSRAFDAALLAAKIYNELGNAKRKSELLALATRLAKSDSSLTEQVNAVAKMALQEKCKLFN